MKKAAKKAKKKSQKKKSQFRKRRDTWNVSTTLWINEKDRTFFHFMAKASREGRL